MIYVIGVIGSFVCAIYFLNKSAELDLLAEETNDNRKLAFCYGYGMAAALSAVSEITFIALFFVNV